MVVATRATPAGLVIWDQESIRPRPVIARSRPESAEGGDVAISGSLVPAMRLPRFTRNDDISQDYSFTPY
ncbi:MAG TPA: hypothetical protein PLG59_15205 [bacterium]|nr:hypothetical protein [bacterium]HQO36009.1 hypothetical protein [bacterium]